MGTATATEVTTWKIDPAHTNVEFAAKHMMITTVRGHFGKVEGEIHLDEQDLSNSTAEATIETPSINTGVEQRDAHLRSADFLDVEKYPTLTFKSRSLKGSGDEFKLVGDLTIRGTTKPITLDVTLEGRAKDPWGGERLGFTAVTKIDRREFGLTWNQALEAGGILVANDIKITIEGQAVKQAA